MSFLWIKGARPLGDVIRLLGSCGVALCLVGSTVSHAASPKYTKKEAEIQAVQTERTAPPKPEATKKRPAPVLTQEQFIMGVQTKIADINEQMIAKMQRLIDITPEGDPEKPEFLFRLAELYNEKRQYESFRARLLDEKIYQAKSEGEKSRLSQEQDGHEKAEKKWLLDAAKTYLTVATNPKYANYNRMDEVLFYLAYMLQQVKRDDESRVFFLRLVKDYPQSRFVPDAYLSFGEFYFTNGDMDAAMKFYDKVTNFPKAKVFGYALYKKGWAYYNLGEFQKSMETFINVIQLARDGKIDRANKAALEKESKKDLVLVYSRVGTPEKAWPFFQKVGGDFAPKMEERLAEIYYEQGKFADSVKVYHELMRLFPDSPMLCEWQYNVVKNSLSFGSKRDQVEELQRLSSVYEAYRTSKQKGATKEQVDECRANTADTLRELATVWHKEAQRTLNRDTYALAQYLYKEYAEKFPKERDAYDMNYWYGELLFKLGEIEPDAAKQRWYWERAAEQYTKVAKLDAQGKYAKDASYAAVISLLNANAAAPDRPTPRTSLPLGAGSDCEEEATNAKDKKKGKTAKAAKDKDDCKEQVVSAEKFKPQPLPPNKQQMIEAFDNYLKYAKNKDPNDDQLIRIKYNKARIYYEFNQFDKALPAFADIADHHSKHELGVISANLLLDSLNMQNKHDDLLKSVDKFITNPDLMKDAQFAADMKRIKAESRWKQADLLMKQKRFKEAARLYIEIFNEAPDAERSAQTLYNAAIAYESARLVGKAIQARQNLIKYKPESPEAKKALYMIGENYQGIAYFSKAAEFFEQFASKYAGEKEAPDALRNATFFRRGLGEDGKAVDDNNLYIKLYGERKPAEAARVFFSIAAVYEKEKKWDQLQKHLNDFLAKYGNRASDLRVLAHVKLGEVLWNRSCSLGETVNGSCLKIERVRSGGAASLGKLKGKRIKGRSQCGPETKSKITLGKRNEAKANEAQKHFNTALALYKQVSKSVPGENETERKERADVLNYAAAQARFMQAEAAYERLLSVPFPQGLVFDPKLKRKNEESKRKFQGWMKDKQKLLELAQKLYQDVLQFKQAHWSIASAARIGQLFQNFADGLYTAPIPAPSALVTQLRQAGYSSGDIQDAVDTFQETYCDQLTDEAGPLEAKAIEGLSRCLEKSTELSWFNEWSRLCEAELNQIRPAEFPLASELRAEPGYAELRPADGILLEDAE